MNNSYKLAGDLISSAKKISVIQAENPDGDSLGSALAFEEILGDLGKDVSLYCPVEIPKYLRYFIGYDRVTTDLDHSADLYIIVDTASSILLSKVLEDPANKNTLEKQPVLVIDHHIQATPDLTFNHETLLEEASSTGEIIYHFATANSWNINQSAAENILAAISSDTLGLSTASVTAETYLVASKLAELGASPATIENRRREFMKKAPEILKYKGELIERIEYYLEQRFALVHIPWEEIKQYSDKYNPSVLVLDEMRLVEGVQVAIAIKTYPDGKLTGKIRTNLPIAADIAGYFGGGGHEYAAGFRVYDSYEEVLPELISACDKSLSQEGSQNEAI